MFVVPTQLLNFDAEANTVKNFYNIDLPRSGEFDQDVKP